MRFTTPFQACSVAFSPFHEDTIAVGSAQHFGLVGNGRASVLAFGPTGISETAGFYTQVFGVRVCVVGILGT